MLDEVSEAVFCYDWALRLVYVNRFGAGLSGRTPAECVGRSAQELGMPEALQSALSAAIEGGAVLDATIDSETSKGLRTLECHVAPWRSAHGEPKGLFALCRDISAVRAQRLLEATLQHTPIGIIIVEAPSGRILVQNDEARRTFGLDGAHLQSFEEGEGLIGYTLDGTRYRAQDWPVARSIRTGEIVAEEVAEVRRADGTYGYARMSSAPVKDEEGRIIAGVVTFHDVTDQRHLYEEEQRLRRASEAATRRLWRLQRLSQAMGSSFSATEAARVLVTEGRAAVGADAAAVWLLDPETRILRAIATDGPSAGGTLGLDDQAPTSEAVRSGRLVLLESAAVRARRYGDVDPAYASFRAWAAVPLIVQHRSVGALELCFAEERAFDEREEAFLLAMAAQSAQAIDRARLFDSERQARERFRFLAEASAVIAASLDYNKTLRQVARLSVPVFADWCAVDLVSSDGGFSRVAVHHRDAAKVDLAYRAARDLPADSDVPFGAPQVIRSGQPEWAARISEELLESAARDAEHLKQLQGLGLQSYVVVPLPGHDRILGAITFVTAESGRQYSAEDVRFAQDIAARAAAALENAMLYEAVKASEERANTAAAHAKDAERRKDEFLAMLGHELRNPLAPITTALELLNRKGGPSTARERDVIARQVSHLSRLVDDLLDVSRITRGKVELRRRPIEMSAVVARAVEMASPLFERFDHTLVLNVPKEGFVVKVDETRMAQVVANLLTNAAKYTEPRGRIEVTVSREDPELVLRVRDNGIGIAPEALPVIFDLFRQGRRSIDRTEGGLGLGLALVKSLVEMHGGRVNAKSEGPGKGSEFIVCLPEARTTQSRPMPAVRTDPQSTRQPRLSRRVLVVDDNLDAAESLADLLRHVGHEVKVAQDGPGALELAARFDPEVAVLDIGLPVMDGYELAAALKAREEAGPIRLIALTGYGQEKDRQRSREAGFDAHLVKPVEIDALLAALEPQPNDE